ncbi:fibronectin type III domain-containing protein [Paenibacillus anseongensis]|uniref:hypothetical protein n=1 Tax=Paenibacillus TaxID=44249 RepID=UPI001FE93B60|nr:MULTISPECIES: hypothetical protein [Paenibacillus]
MRKIAKLFSFMVILASLSFLMVTQVFATGLFSENQIPKMTSKTLPSGIVSASSENAITPAWLAFDGNSTYDGDGYGGWGTPQKTGWLAYEFPNPKVINKYVMSHSNQWRETLPKSWTFEGWNGTAWNVLDSRSNITDWVSYTVKEFTFNNTNSYSKYRINVTENNGSVANTNNLIIVELQMMEGTQSTPITLTATGGDAKVDLSWNVVAGATNYTVKRSEVSGGPYTTIATAINGTSYTDTTVTNGKQYYYVITAVNTGNEIGISNDATATPHGTVTLPITLTLTATGGDAKVDLSWNVIAGTTNYNVKRSEVSGGPYTTIATGVNGTSYTDTTVTNGKQYYYVVTTVNTGNETGISNEASATPQGTVTQPPAETSGRAILTIIMDTGLEKEFDLSMTEVNSFIAWYEAKAAGTGTAIYAIDKHNNNKGPFTSRKDYVVYGKILSFEVNQYE